VGRRGGRGKEKTKNAKIKLLESSRFGDIAVKLPQPLQSKVGGRGVIMYVEI
jgi:hypothetical protein